MLLFHFAVLKHGTRPSGQFAPCTIRKGNIKVPDPSTIHGSTAEPLEHEGEKTQPTRVSLTNGKSETNTNIQQNPLPITKSTLTSTQSGRTQSTPPNLGSTYATLFHASAKQIHVLLSTKLLSPLAQEDTQDVFPSRASVHGVRLLLREAHGAWRVAPAIQLDPLRPNRRRNLF